MILVTEDKGELQAICGANRGGTSMRPWLIEEMGPADECAEVGIISLDQTASQRIAAGDQGGFYIYTASQRKELWRCSGRPDGGQRNGNFRKPVRGVLDMCGYDAAARCDARNISTGHRPDDANCHERMLLRWLARAQDGAARQAVRDHWADRGKGISEELNSGHLAEPQARVDDGGRVRVTVRPGRIFREAQHQCFVLCANVNTQRNSGRG